MRLLKSRQKNNFAERLLEPSSLVGFFENKALKLSGWSVQKTQGSPKPSCSLHLCILGGSGLLSPSGSEHELDRHSDLEFAI